MRLPLVLPESGAKAVDVVGLGESSVDLVAVVDGYPAADSKQRLESLTSFTGGQVATAMVACARLGWRARYVGSLGADHEGDAIVRSLTREGLDVRVVRRDGHRSRSALVIVDRRTGGRTVLEQRDPALAFDPGEIEPGIVTGGRILLVDATDPVASRRAAAFARAAAVPVVLDVDRVASERIDTSELLRAVDVVVTAESFPAAYTGASNVGEGLRRLAEISGASLVVATLGADGSLARCRGVEIRTAGFRVDTVDSTGAGDAFRGGFIAAWLREGTGARVDTLLQYANAVAALNCRSLGAQEGLPTTADVDAFVTGTLREESK